MSLEEKTQAVFKNVLDISPDEIKPGEPLDQSLGIDSTEMVEVCVALKKEFGLEIPNNEFKKTQSFTELIEKLKEKGAS